VSAEQPFYRVYGMSQSFFTRKLEGYLAYKGIPYRLRRCAGGVPDARAAGWPGGVPVVRTPEGAWCWDTTDVIHHLEARFPEPAVLPPDPVQRFLCYALEDFADEWLYRAAVGSRWHFDENGRVGGYELARDVTHEAPLSGDQAAQVVRSRVGATCAAHFANDPLCRRWLDADAPALVKHTQRLLEPEGQRFGAWAAPGDVPDSLVALLAQLGRHYLPWVSRAVRSGAAPLVFADGRSFELRPTPFLVNARRVLLARYAALRCPALDAVLERAGVLRYYADFVADAGSIPDPRLPPRPRWNRPFAPPGQEER
jgi:glutathione S-transferase